MLKARDEIDASESKDEPQNDENASDSAIDDEEVLRETAECRLVVRLRRKGKGTICAATMCCDGWHSKQGCIKFSLLDACYEAQRDSPIQHP